MDARTAYITALRELADFLEATPEFPIPYTTSFDSWIHRDREAYAKAARALGSSEKKVGDEWFALTRRFGPLKLDLCTSRDTVCERVLIRTEIEPEYIIPAQPEQIVAAKEVAVYEWRCGSVMAPEVQEGGAA